MVQNVDIDQASLDRVKAMLNEKFKPADHEEAQELILGALQEVQRELGWVPVEASTIVADHLGVSVNRVYGLLTFYADFRTEAPGNHFMLLCHGAACFVAGSQCLVNELRDNYGITQDETTADGELTVQIVNGCLGVCDLAPIIQMDHQHYFGDLDIEKFNQVISDTVASGPAGHQHEDH